MELMKSDNGRWKPGQSGNANGRPVGSRSAFSASFMRDLAEVWAEHGKGTILHTARTQPEVFFATCSRLLPKDVAISIQANVPALDQSDLSILRAIKDAIPNADELEPQAVLEHVLRAIRSYGASPIIDVAPDRITEGPKD